MLLWFLERFEMCIRRLSGDVKQVIVNLIVEFRGKVEVGEINLELFYMDVI